VDSGNGAGRARFWGGLGGFGRFDTYRFGGRSALGSSRAKGFEIPGQRCLDVANAQLLQSFWALLSQAFEVTVEILAERKSVRRLCWAHSRVYSTAAHICSARIELVKSVVLKAAGGSRIRALRTQSQQLWSLAKAKVARWLSLATKRRRCRWHGGMGIDDEF